MNKASKWIPVATLVAVAGLAGSAQAFDRSEWPTALSFDGYCDGITELQVSRLENEAVIRGTWNLNNCGIPSTTVAGLVNENVRREEDAIGTYDVVAQGQGFAPLIVEININRTWVYRDMNGKLLNWGTWSAGAPQAAQQGAPVSAQPQR